MGQQQQRGSRAAHLYVSISMMMGPCSSAYFLANSIDCGTQHRCRQRVW
jgi:hypothetical protein